MPGWQQLWPQLEGKVNFLSIAVDVQGPTVVKPWVERAKATFTTVVDSHNALADSVGFNAVPTLLLFDAKGRLVHGPIGFDIRREGMAGAILTWVDSGQIGEVLTRSRMEVANPDEAGRLFREGQKHLANGDREAALATWRRARDLAPKNWLIRKQIWAVEHPERFYDGPVDYDWQKEQLAQEQRGHETI